MEFKSWAGRHDANMQAFLRAMLAQVTPEVKATLEPKGAGPTSPSACAKACSSQSGRSRQNPGRDVHGG